MKLNTSLMITGSIVVGGFIIYSVAFGAAAPAAQEQYDFGDAPDPLHPTLLVSNGARHAFGTTAWFGTTVDAEREANVIDRDNDDGLVGENPVTFTITNAHSRGFSRIFDFFRSKTLYVNILIDRNNSGTWESPAEWVVQNQTLRTRLGATRQYEAVGPDGKKVSWDRVTEGWLRMTLTDAPLANYDGTTGEPFAMGETEDYGPTLTKTGEPQYRVWCIVDAKKCDVFSDDEAATAKQQGKKLKGPYPTIAACSIDCKEKTIETPTPRRKFPPEKPVEKTIPTKSPAPTPPASTEMHNLDLTAPTQQSTKTFTCPAGYPHARPGNWGDGDCTKGYCTAEDTLDSKYANFIYNNKIEKFVYVCGNLPRENACHDFPPAGVCPETPTFEQYP